MTTVTTATPVPDVGTPVSTGVYKLSSGRVVRRTELSNGDIIETDAFAGDFVPLTGDANEAGEIEMKQAAKQAPVAPPSQ